MHALDKEMYGTGLGLLLVMAFGFAVDVALDPAPAPQVSSATSHTLQPNVK